MHENLLESDEIDNNLYPALMQVFALVLLGYIAGAAQMLNKQQVFGLNKFVSTFALPALLFKSIVVLEFSSVNWLFLISIFLSKTIVFVTAIAVTLVTLRPINIGMAAIFGIYVSQSNDFALGFPIVSAIYSKEHPDYLHYIYLIAPISLCILNPIAFLMMEANEALVNRNKLTQNPNEIETDEDAENLIEIKMSDGSEVDLNKSNTDFSITIESKNEKNLMNRKSKKIVFEEQHDYSLGNNDSTSIPTATTSSDEAANSTISNNDFKELIRMTNSQTSPDPVEDTKKKFSTWNLIKVTLWSTISNPIVFMTLIGLVSNFALGQKIPSYIDPILTALANSFSALALFFLGFTMVGKIKNLSFKAIVIILLLVFTKSLIFPLLNRELVLHLGNLSHKSMDSETESLSSFAFLYGTFPAAPSIFFYITRYKAIGDDLVSSALVFGTLASAPLMMISGKMISFKYNSSSISNFEDIECKTAYGFSILNWFCCIWVLYIFIASGRFWRRSHRFTSLLILSQMANSAVHIVWSSLTQNIDDLDKSYGLMHVGIGLFTAYLTRCWVLSIMLNLISLLSTQNYASLRMNQIINKIANCKLVYYSIGLGFPMLATGLSLLIGGIPEKQKMMISVGKPQIIISIALLAFLITSVFYLLIIFARTKTNQDNLMTFIRKYNTSPKTFAYKSSANGGYAYQNVATFDQQDERLNISNTLENYQSPEAFNSEDNLTFKKLSILNAEFQLIPHISLVIILVFNFLMCLFFQLWILFDESKSGIFYELELIDTTLLYGQGFFTFLAFGFDNNLIFAPVVFKVKEILRMIEPFKLAPIGEISNETTEICSKFKEKYASRCIEDIVKNHRFHHRFYICVFTGNDFVDWSLNQKLVSNRKQAVELGKQLIQGRVIEHVTKQRTFFDDGFNYYRFD